MSPILESMGAAEFVLLFMSLTQLLSAFTGFIPYHMIMYVNLIDGFPLNLVIVILN